MKVTLWLGQVSVSPTSAGMPGAQLVSQMLNWLAQLAVWGSLASILAGASGYVLKQIQVPHGLDTPATPRRGAPVAADVLRNLEEPRQLELRHDAAAKSLLRVQERLLDGVLCILSRAEQAQAVAEDSRGVALIEKSGRIDGLRPRGSE